MNQAPTPSNGAGNQQPKEPTADTRNPGRPGNEWQAGRRAKHHATARPTRPANFRFQQMEIWKRAAALSTQLFKMADDLEHAHLFRFAEQLRAATLSVTNNIAEGSGSCSDTDFANFLNTARRSVFEVANILLILSDNGAINYESIGSILPELEEESRMIWAFRNSLLR